MMTAPLTPPPVTGTTFYVDKNSLGGTCNNNNPGTQTQPWCSITKAMQTLTAGQRAYIREGTYNEGGLRPTNSGTPGNYITFEAFPGETPDMNCANGLEFHHPNQQFFVCNDTTVNNKLHGCHHWWFTNVKAHDTPLGNTAQAWSGFILATHHIVISNSEIYNVGGMAIYTGSAEQGHDFIFEFLNVHDVGWYGDDDGAVKCGTESWNCIIRYSTAFNNYRRSNATSPCFSGPTQCTGITGFYYDIDRSDLHPGAMSYMYNNIAFDNDQGLQATASPSMHIFNNISYHNGFTPTRWPRPDYGRGLNVSTGGINVPYADFHVYNNVIYGNYREGIWVQQPSRATANIHLKNNIFMNNAQAGGSTADLFLFTGAANIDANYDLIYNTAGAKINYNNTLYNSVAAFLARSGNTTELNVVTTPATFVNAASGDFHLTSTSAGKDAGTTIALVNYDKDNVTRPAGSACDIGAYEYGSGNISLSPPTNLRIVP
jgi:hypothetical protein